MVVGCKYGKYTTRNNTDDTEYLSCRLDDRAGANGSSSVVPHATNVVFCYCVMLPVLVEGMDLGPNDFGRMGLFH